MGKATNEQVIAFMNDNYDEAMRILRANHEYWRRKRLLDAQVALAIGVMWLTAAAAFITGSLLIHRVFACYTSI